MLKGLINRLYSVVPVVLTLALVMMLAGSVAFAKKKGKAKRQPRVTFEQCCEKNSNDTTKCQSMRGVAKKKQKAGKKWVAKSCPQPAAPESSATDELSSEEE